MDRVGAGPHQENDPLARLARAVAHAPRRQIARLGLGPPPCLNGRLHEKPPTLARRQKPYSRGKSVFVLVTNGRYKLHASARFPLPVPGCAECSPTSA